MVIILLNSSVVVQPISKSDWKKIGIGVGAAAGAGLLAGGIGYGLNQRSKSKELATQAKVAIEPAVDVQRKVPRPPSMPNPNAQPKLVAETTYLSTPKYGPHFGNVPPAPSSPPPVLSALPAPAVSQVVVSPNVPAAPPVPQGFIPSAPSAPPRLALLPQLPPVVENKNVLPARLFSADNLKNVQLKKVGEQKPLANKPIDSTKQNVLAAAQEQNNLFLQNAMAQHNAALNKGKDDDDWD